MRHSFSSLAPSREHRSKPVLCTRFRLLMATRARVFKNLPVVTRRFRQVAAEVQHVHVPQPAEQRREPVARLAPEPTAFAIPCLLLLPSHHLAPHPPHP